MSRDWTIVSVEARALDAAMTEPFEIAGGVESSVKNALARVALDDGAIGWGEGAPMAAYNGETQDATLAAMRRAARELVGRDLRALRPLLEMLEELLGPGLGAARAALGMALADAWSRRAKIPLRLLFGGAGTRLFSDVTVALVPPARAAEAARRIRAFGVKTIKIKVGRDADEDLARVLAVVAAAPRARLILDANQGYGPKDSLKLLRRLRAKGIRPALFEQPAAKDDLEGLGEVQRSGLAPVAADETAASRAAVLRIAKQKAAAYVNVKLMKAGLLEAWDIALAARAAGLGLMIGGNVESSLAMSCAAHFAAGLGGFEFVDLDTPLWLKKDPMKGIKIKYMGAYDLAPVRCGIGTTPARDWDP